MLGASWGAVLGLAYPQAHPASVSELVLFSVVGGTRREVEWATRGMGRFLPEAWARFRAGVPEAERDGDLSAAYARLLRDPDPAVHVPAAQRCCDWDDRQMRVPGEPPSARYRDPAFRLCSARLVTHYWSQDHFIADGELARNAARLAGIPGVLVRGRARPRASARPVLGSGPWVAGERAGPDRRRGPSGWAGDGCRGAGRDRCVRARAWLPRLTAGASGASLPRRTGRRLRRLAAPANGRRLRRLGAPATAGL